MQVFPEQHDPGRERDDRIEAAHCRSYRHLAGQAAAGERQQQRGGFSKPGYGGPDGYQGPPAAPQRPGTAGERQGQEEGLDGGGVVDQRGREPARMAGVSAEEERAAAVGNS